MGAISTDHVRVQIDIELNLVKNILSSYKAQGGMAGPASNIYGVCVVIEHIL